MDFYLSCKFTDMKIEKLCTILMLKIFVILTLLSLGSSSRSDKSVKKTPKKSCDFRWSVWSDFSPCSRSCGLGIKTRQRTCYEYGPGTRPVAGRFCRGRTRDHKACNVKSCPRGSRDFRELQCSFFNGQKYAGRTYHWKPFVQDAIQDPCALFCSAEGKVVKFSQIVVDGTRCGSSSGPVCVAGICVPIGCDNQPYSNKTSDKCGECGGNNSTCRTISNRIVRRIPAGYTELLRIPFGSRYVKVTERPRSDVILMVRNDRGTATLEGQSSRDRWSDTKLMAGTLVYFYRRKNGLENIRAEGPLNETVVVKGFARKASMVSLLFEYTISASRPDVRSDPKLDNTDPSSPWQSLLYRHVLTGKALIGSDPNIHLYNTSLVTSTLRPYCHEHTETPRGHHGKKSKTMLPVERFQILKGRGSGGRRHNSRRRQDSNRQTIPKLGLDTQKHSYIAFTEKGKYGNVSYVRKSKRIKPISTVFQTKAEHGLRYHLKYPNIQKSKANRKQTNSGSDSDRSKLRRNNQDRTSESAYISHISKNKNNRSGTVDRNVLQERMFILNVRKNASSAVHSGIRKPVEEPSPTFMPNKKDSPVEDLSMHRGQEDSEEGGSPGLQVDLSVQVAARQTKKAEKRRRGRERGRKRKKEDRNRRRFRWLANHVSPCTSTCEVGTTVTLFSCYRYSGEKVDDKFCDSDTKPPPSHHACATKTCTPRWVAGLWSECSESCGEGTQHRTARCWQLMAPGFDSTVRDFTCKPDEKPETVRACRKHHSCVPQWEMSLWEECSTECGYGIQLRHVRCSSEKEAACNTRKRPTEKRPCRNKPCVNQWYILPWSSCSGMCGIRKRKVYCRDSHGRVVDDRKCDFNAKPLTVHACGRCKNKWVPQEWGECSVTCGGGVTNRRVVCGTSRGGNFHIRPDSFCVKEVRPPTTTTCRSAPCGAIWYTTEWTECSETCGISGVRYREVRCYGGSATEHCDPKSRPEDKMKCELPVCEQRPACEDDGETRCDLVASAKLCSHKYYRKACCRTCSAFT